MFLDVSMSFFILVGFVWIMQILQSCTRCLKDKIEGNKFLLYNMLNVMLIYLLTLKIINGVCVCMI